MIDYTHGDPVPGDFQHKGGDCETHGVNIPFFRAYQGTGPFFCVRCSVDAMSKRYDEELSRDSE